MPEICVMGLGYVGLPTASLLANAGFEVLGVDVNPRVVASLQSGKTVLKEAGLATLVSAACNSGNLVAAAEPQPADTFILCVPTPITEDKRADISLVEAATRKIVPHVKLGNLIILESTSPVGTTRNRVGRILQEAGFEPGVDVHVCYCPERVLPGNTVAELVNNDRVIGGITPDCAQRAAEIYARFSQGKMALTDDRTAELVKLMENTYRDVNIALANLFARVAEDVGINAWEAIEYANRHPRVNVLTPGPGVGGHCIPVDPWFLAESFPDHAGLLHQARTINDGQPARILERLFAVGPLEAGDKIAILGAAYKADIDDPRESPTEHLVTAADQQGLTAAVHDPHVAAGEWGHMTVCNDINEVLDGAAAVILMTNHKEYRSLSARNFADRMTGKLVADTRNWLNHAALRRSGFHVMEVGKGDGASWSFDQSPSQLEWSVGPAAVNGRRTANPTP